MSLQTAATNVNPSTRGDDKVSAETIEHAFFKVDNLVDGIAQPDWTPEEENALRRK